MSWESHRNGTLTRRHVLAGIASCSAVSLLGMPARAAIQPLRSLHFQNFHTGEALEIVYWRDGRYLAHALGALDHHLRDHRTGGVKRIDRRLFDLLYEVRAFLGAREPYLVVSGYRSPETNAMLARRSSRVAKNSYHMHGMAIDLRLPEAGLSRLRDAGMALARGGVGYYPRNDFVHLDTGPVRSW